MESHEAPLPRREFLRLAASLGVSAFACASARAGFRRESIEEDVARRVRDLRGSRSVALKLLLPIGSEENLAPVIERFRALTGVDVGLESIGVDDMNPSMITRTYAGRGHFDVALPATFGVPDLVEAECVLPLDELADRYEPEGYNDGSLYTIGDRYKGRLYGYQTDGDTYLAFYNRAMLRDPTEVDRFEQQHGYPLEPARTWEELDQMMAFFHRPEEGRHGGCLFRNDSYTAWEWWLRFHAKGRYPFGDDMEPRIGDDEAVDALRELIAASRHQHPSAVTNDLFANWSRFAEGHSFSNFGWGGSQKALLLAGMHSLEFGLMPGGVSGSETFSLPFFNWGWNYTVSAMTKEPEIAYLFTLFACAPQTSIEAVRATGGFFDPYREEHYRDEQIERAYGRPFLDAHRASLRSSIPDLYLSGMGEYWGVLKEYIHRADRGRLDPKTALRLAAAQWRRITAERGEESQLEQWRYLKSLYPAETARFLT